MDQTLEKCSTKDSIYSLQYLQINLFDESLLKEEKQTVSQIINELNTPSMIVDIVKLRQLVSKGIPQQAIGLRAIVWKLLLGYLPPDRQKWIKVLRDRRESYQLFLEDFLVKPKVPPQSVIDQHEKDEELIMQGNASSSNLQFQNVTDHPLNREPESLWQSFFNDNEMYCQIEKDTDRTRQEIEFFISKTQRKLHVQIPFPTHARREKKGNSTNHLELHSDVLSRILFIYAKLNRAVEYVQGMNEVLAPIYYSFSEERLAEPNIYDEDGFIQVEADSFFFFITIMGLLKDRFMRQMDDCQQGLRSKCFEMKQYIQVYNYDLWAHLEQLQIDPQFYALRWLLLLYSQEFTLLAVQRLWDSLFTKRDILQFLNFIGLAILDITHGELMEKLDFAVVMTRLQRIEDLNENILIERAEHFERLHNSNNHNTDS